jgi:hypothetical protein
MKLLRRLQHRQADKAKLAYQTTLELATKHDLGFFKVSLQDEEVRLPAEGRLVPAHQKGTTN